MYFKPEMIEAIVRGDKTETRRIVKPGEELVYGPVYNPHRVYGYTRSGVWNIAAVRCNDRVKWQESAVYVDDKVDPTYAVCPGRGKPGAWWKPDTGEWVGGNDIVNKNAGIPYMASHAFELGWQPLRIRVLELRDEPLQTITVDDCVREGIRPYTFARGLMTDHWEPRWAYIDLWKSINGPKSWDANPLVWVISFEVAR